MENASNIRASRRTFEDERVIMELHAQSQLDYTGRFCGIWSLNLLQSSQKRWHGVFPADAIFMTLGHSRCDNTHLYTVVQFKYHLRAC